MESQVSNRPITNIDKALGKRILIKLKGRRTIKAVLKSFDEHLNLFLEETVEITHHWDREQNAVVKKENDLEAIILRGDNVVFLTLDEITEDIAAPVARPSEPSEEIASPAEISEPTEEIAPATEPSEPTEEIAPATEPSEPSEETNPSDEPSEPSEPPSDNPEP